MFDVCIFLHVFLCVAVCMSDSQSKCLIVYMYVCHCVYASRYFCLCFRCMHLWMYAHMHIPQCIDGCLLPTYLSMCMYVSMLRGCMFVCMHVCVYVSM